jgi:hypothetical protein
MNAMALLAVSSTFVKGTAVIVAAMVLFVGSVYLLLSAIFGLRMAYLVLAVAFFGWMIILSMIWTFGQPPILGVTGTKTNLGPRGTEPHWQVFAAGTGSVASKYPVTKAYPAGPWHPPDTVSKSAVATVTTAVQDYLVNQGAAALEKEGTTVCTPESSPTANCFNLDLTAFVVQDVEFATAGSTHLAAAHAFYAQGGPEITVFAYHDHGNVQVYSYAFLIASILGFAIHLPFLDRAEKKRKAILTGGTAPPWYGPA